MADPDLAEDAELLAEVTAARPELTDLARVASIASIVEPSLLRRLHRQLLPGLDAGIEADLWFSPLTHVASATAWTMRTGIATLLRAQLGTPTHRPTAYAARDIVLQAHAGHSDMLQLEDTIIFETVIGNDHGVEQAFQRVLATLDAAPQLASDVIRWFGQAQRRVPPATLTSAPASRLSAVAALHLDRVVPDSILAADHFPDGLGGGAPTTLPTTEVTVALLEEGLRFGSVAAVDGAVIMVPLTRPLVVEAGWTSPAGELLTRVVRAEPGEVATLPGLQGEVVLRTLAGTRFRLTRAAPALTVDHALDMLQSLTLVFHMRGFFDEDVRGDRAVRELLSLADEQSSARYEHVRVMGEYFTQPVRRFLAGGENPLSVPSNVDLGSRVEAEVAQSAARAPATSELANYPGIDRTGLFWPSFRDYIDWLTGSMGSYITTIVERLGPRLVPVGFAVTDEVWQAARAIARPDALPAEGRRPMGRPRSGEPERLVYNVERADVPALISALVPPILDAIAQAETDRPPPVPVDHPDLAEGAAESDRMGAAALEASDLPGARAYYEQSLVLYERAEDESGIAATHRQLSTVTLLMDDLEAAEQHQTSALEIDPNSGGSARAEGEYQLGLIAVARGDVGGAEKHYQTARQLSERAGDDRTRARALLQLGRLALQQRSPDEAQRYFETALELSEGLGDLKSIEDARGGLEEIAYQRPM